MREGCVSTEARCSGPSASKLLIQPPRDDLRGCILAHTMGLGKTLTTLAFTFMTWRTHKALGRLLILCPKVVTGTWGRPAAFLSRQSSLFLKASRATEVGICLHKYLFSLQVRCSFYLVFFLSYSGRSPAVFTTPCLEWQLAGEEAEFRRWSAQLARTPLSFNHRTVTSPPPLPPRGSRGQGSLTSRASSGRCGTTSPRTSARPSCTAGRTAPVCNANRCRNRPEKT